MIGSWHFRSPLQEIVIFERRHVTPAQLATALPASVVTGAFDGWVREPLERRTLAAMCDRALGLSPALAWGRAEYERAKHTLATALRRGELIALRVERREVIVPIQQASEPLGPQDEPTAPDTWIAVEVYGSTGEPLAGEPCLIVPPDADAAVALSATGTRRIARLEPASQTMCTVSFPEIMSRHGTVPPEAKPQLRAGASQVTRPELFNAFGAMTNDKHVFQLKRRNATVVEFEHFTEGGAVFLPGASPAPLRDGAARPTGIDVLKACLLRAQSSSLDQMIIAGHDADSSEERAKNLLYLLTANREAWRSLSRNDGHVIDYQHILKWIAETGGGGGPSQDVPSASRARDVPPWEACDPGELTGSGNKATHDAIQAFQENYNADMLEGLFPESKPGGRIGVDGIVGKQTWGAMFDCYMRALRPVARATKPAGADYPIGDESTRTGRNARRPIGEHPFVVLGTNGPGNAPITIAKYGTPFPDGSLRPDGDNNYVEMRPLNPQYAFGVDPEFVGQALNVPAAWAPHLVKAGYTVQQDRSAPPPPITAPEPGPPALPAPPKAVGCGTHHVKTPFANAQHRRSAARCVEVLFLDDDHVPLANCGPGDGPCDAARCELYDPREYGFEYAPVGGASVTVRVYDVATNAPLPRTLVLLDGPKTVSSTTGKAGLAFFGGLVPGRYVITADRDDYVDNAAVIEVPAHPQGPAIRFLVPADGAGGGSGEAGDSETTPTANNVDLPLAKVTVTIQIFEPGVPDERAGLGGTRVTLERPGFTQTVEMDSNGTKSVSLPKGVYSLRAERPGYVQNRLDISVKGGETFKIPLEPKRTVDARWVDTLTSCGDQVRIEGSVTPAPPSGTTATIEVFVAGSSTPGDPDFTLPISVGGGTNFAATWASKTATSAWRSDRMRFRVTLKGPASTQRGESTNELAFRDRPTTATVPVHNLNEVVPGQPVAVENHAGQLQASRVRYELRIGLAGAGLNAAKQAVMKSVIEAVWNSGFANKFFHRTSCGRGNGCNCAHDCCKVSWHLDVNIVTSGAHVTVTIMATAPGVPLFRSWTSDTTATWGDPPINAASTHAHEVGHLLGNYDEYVTGVTDPSGVQPAAAPPTQLNLMSTSGNTRLLARHFRWALRFLNANAGGDVYATVER